MQRAMPPRSATYRPLKAKALEDEHQRVFAPLIRKTGIAAGEFENIVRIITTDHFGPYKSEVSLTAAIAKLDALDHYRDELKANNLHELMRCHEAMNIQSVAKIVAHAALARKESRFVPYHYRSDYPETTRLLRTDGGAARGREGGRDPLRALALRA